MSRLLSVPVLARTALLSLIAFVIASCGGGGGGGTTGTNTVVNFSVDWGARSRVTGPGSAQSFTMRIVGAGVPSGDFVYTGNRDANPAAHTQAFTTPGQAVAGSHTVVFTFYADVNGTGAVVGNATATMTLNANGTLSGTITTVGTVASVTVASGQTVAVGELKQLVFTARDSSNNVVAVTPGAAVWAVVTGGGFIAFEQGQARGVAAGTPTVTASVDGHVSPAMSVSVTSTPSVTVSVSPSTVTLDRGQTQQFNATVTGTGNTAVTWSVVEGGGGTISSGGLYTAPNTSGTFTVRATSVAEPAAFGTATVNVAYIPLNKIFYTLNSFDTVEYRQINSDGTGDSLVSSFSGSFDAIAPSPTAAQFAFAYTSDPLATDPIWRLYKNATVAISGATQLSATNFRFFGTIRYTPDGSQIVFTGSVSEGEFGVYRINADGTGGPVRLDDGEEAAVSPDGTKIVYTKLDGPSVSGEVWTMNLDGTTKTRLTNNAFEDWYPQWSKDGTKICFSSDRNGAQFDIYTMNANGTSVVRVTTSGDDEYGSSFSPSGAQIAVAVLGLDVDDTGLYRVNTDGLSRTPLKIAANIDLGVFWSPGGSSQPGGIGPWSGGGNPRAKLRRR